MKKIKLNRFKIFFNNPWKIIIVSLLSVMFLNIVIALTTGTNLLGVGFSKLLNSLGIYTEEVSSIAIKSDGWDSEVGGAWKVEKSAKWTGLGETEVIFDLETIMKIGDNYKDVIFVLDVSGSMRGDKLEKMKNDVKELTSHLLSNKENKVSLISFNSESSILSDFTNDKNLIIEMVDNLLEEGGTNYNVGLKNVDLVMEGYVKEANRDLVTLFLTDGFPNEDIPNQVATYEILKEKYPYMTINGVQYEMGSTIIDDIKNISDNQFYAYMDNLDNVLFEAAYIPETFSKFEIVDYVHNDYFFVESEEDIKVSVGESVLIDENGNQKIIWKLDNNRTGFDATLKVKLKLKNQYIGKEGFYPTNKGEDIFSELVDSHENIKTSFLTPVLKSNFDVIYDTNPPEGCNIKSEMIEKYFAYENVVKQNTELTCPGYVFKGWEIVNTGLTIINDDTFIMPSNDVTIRAIWTKQLISKSMNGKVNTKDTLYRVVKADAEKGSYSAEYTGINSENFENKVYYYKGAAKKNNVLFGGFCWRIVRTTETGGVKMIYNGIPDENGGCNNTGTSSQLSSKSAFNKKGDSLSYVGYMYNKSYPVDVKTMYSTNFVYSSSWLSGKHWFSDTFDYNEEDNTYTLINPTQLTSNYDFYSLIGKYVIIQDDEDLISNYVCYVVGINGMQMYYIPLFEGGGIDDYSNNKYIFGDSYVLIADGTYKINNSTTIEEIEWTSYYESVMDKYLCIVGRDNVCNEVFYVSETTDVTYTYTNLTDFVYGNSFVYDEFTKKYTLVDTVSFNDWYSNYDKINNYHYTCFNTNGVCTSIKYIHHTGSDESFYIELTDGKSVDDAINEMLYDEDVNKYDSTIKTFIETWFENNLLDYEKYLEDTVFCNSRSIDDLGGWNPNGGDNSSIISFNSAFDKDLVCENRADRFTKYEENGNGKLKYPVGMIDHVELMLAMDRFTQSAYSSYYLRTKENYWIISTSGFQYDTTYSSGVFSSGTRLSAPTYASNGVRPVISLKSDMEYIRGDGSVNSPYIVYLD